MVSNLYTRTESAMLSKFATVTVLVVFSLSPLTSQNRFWKQTNGPSAPRIVGDLLNHPPGDIYCLSKNVYDGYLLRSPDNGTSWKDVNLVYVDPVVGSRINLSVADLFSYKDSTIYASTSGQGVYRSKDNGATWEKCFDKLGSIPSHTLLGINSSGHLFAKPFMPSDGYVYCSTNNGASWEKRENGLDVRFATDFKFVIDTHDNLYIENFNNKLYRSTDGGLQWSVLYPNRVEFFAVHPQEVFFLGEYSATNYTSKVLRSTDQGRTWSDILPSISSTKIKVRDFNIGPDGQIYVSTKDTLRISQDLGNSWRVANLVFVNESISDVTVLQGGKILVGTDKGRFYFSSNNGVSWTMAGAQLLRDVSVNCIAVNSKDRIFAGSSSDGLFSSLDNGAHWIVVSGTAFTNEAIMSVAVDRLDHLYVSTSSSWLFLSTDDGSIWTKLSNPSPAKTISAMAFNSKNHIFAASYNELFRSTTGGVTWDSKALSNSTYALSFHVDASDNIYASISDTLCFSSDNGETWTKRNMGLPGKARVSSLEVTSQGAIYLGLSGGGLYYSTDQGNSWMSKPTGLRGPANPIGGIVCLPNNELYINVGAADGYVGYNFEDFGVFISTNNATSWRFLNTSAIWSIEEASCLLGTKDNRILAGVTHGVLIGSTSSASEVVDLLNHPSRYALEQNYPNPFNPSTTIRYELPREAVVSLKIFNTLGQLVATLVDEKENAGYHQAQWNANVASDIYFYRLQVGKFVETKKMILLK